MTVVPHVNAIALLDTGQEI